LSERSRGHNWGVTVAWFVTGATVGGLLLGLAITPLIVFAAWIDSPPIVTASIVAAVALAALVTDLQLSHHRLPAHHRQVDEVWIGRYRQWIYASGFGLQIGTGFATVIMTGALYLFVTLLIVAGSIQLALLAGALFGFVRGMAIMAGVHLTDAIALRDFHRKFDSLSWASIALVVAAECVTIVAGFTSVNLVWVGAIVATAPIVAYALKRREGWRSKNPKTSFVGSPE